MYKKDFPLFKHHPELVYLDSAATALKPEPVIRAVTEYLEAYSTNAARGLYPLAESTSAKLAAVRKRVADFVHGAPEEIVFTSGTTDGINRVARMLEPKIKEDGVLLVSSSEHHSNFLPWVELAARTGVSVRQVKTTKEGFIDTADLEQQLDPAVTIAALTAVSNVYGVRNDIPALVSRIRKHVPQAFVVVDAAQLAAHGPLDVSAWDADAVAFSGHKLYGPTGIGVLWMKREHFELPPAMFGGGMVLRADTVIPEYKTGPERFESGTLNLEGVFGLGAALSYVNALGLDTIAAHEQKLTAYALSRLQESFGDKLHILGIPDPKQRIGLISFTLSGLHPHDIASLLGAKHICVRAGEHCAAPLHRELGISASTRISFGLYTQEEDIDAFITALKKALALLA